LAKNLWALRKILTDAVEIRRIGRVSVLVSDEVKIPFSTAINFRSSVVLPMDILGNSRDLSIAMEHELQHHRQGDTWFALVLEVIKVLYFWNPAMYLWFDEMADLQEHACDEAVLSRSRCSAFDHGSCLVSVAGMAIENRLGTY